MEENNSKTPESNEDRIKKFDIEINEQKLILDIELFSKSLIINIIDTSEMIRLFINTN